MDRHKKFGLISMQLVVGAFRSPLLSQQHIFSENFSVRILGRCRLNISIEMGSILGKSLEDNLKKNQEFLLASQKAQVCIYELFFQRCLEVEHF